MDRRYLFAFLITLVILLFYPHYLKMIAPTHSRTASYESPQVPETRPAEPPPRREREAKTVRLHKGAYKTVLSSEGGSLLLLKQGENVFYEAGVGEGGIFGIRLANEADDIERSIFEIESPPREGEGPVMTFEKPGEYRMTKRFFLGTGKPNLVLEVGLENLSQRERHFTLEVDYALGLKLSGPAEETSAKTVRFSAGEVRETKLKLLEKKPLVAAENLEWHGLLRKYDALLVRPDLKIVAEETKSEGREFLKSRLKLAPLTLGPGGKTSANFLIYAGPQSYQPLKAYGLDFEKILTQGTLGYVRLGILLGLNYFQGVTKNYGVAILLVTLIIKILFTPLTHISYQSMGKMQALQPKIQALQRQHKNDPQRLNKETMELYRRNRVNPMGGCLPMVLQIPIFIAFYQVLAETADLKGAPFVAWIGDLSQPDRLFSWPADLPFVGSSFNLLPVLMIGSMLWQQRLTPQTTTTPGQEKIMYLMPIVFGFVFYNLPSGLVLYWFVNNLLTIFHQLVIKRIPVILHHEDSSA